MRSEGAFFGQESNSCMQGNAKLVGLECVGLLIEEDEAWLI
jgi:hypothetical protein